MCSRVYTVTEAAAILRVDPRNLWRQIRDTGGITLNGRHVPAIRIGTAGTIRIPAAPIDQATE